MHHILYQYVEKMKTSDLATSRRVTGEEGGDGVTGTRGGRPLAKALGQPGAPPPPSVGVWV